MSETVPFRGAEIPKIEAEALTELEIHLNEEFTMMHDSDKWSGANECVVEEGRVICIGLYDYNSKTIIVRINHWITVKERCNSHKNHKYIS